MVGTLSSVLFVVELSSQLVGDGNLLIISGLNCCIAAKSIRYTDPGYCPLCIFKQAGALLRMAAPECETACHKARSRWLCELG